MYLMFGWDKLDKIKVNMWVKKNNYIIICFCSDFDKKIIIIDVFYKFKYILLYVYV